MHSLAAELFPICRSITGEGVRETLHRLRDDLPLRIHEVPTGTRVLDWKIPLEWNVRDAWVKDPSGRKVIDFAASNLHVVNYSLPARGRMPLRELDAHLHSLPDQPDAIPYKTSYYQEAWGFCLSHAERESLPDGDYEYCIDSSFRHGSLTYGEAYLPGAREEEILFTAHVCHPSLANDNLSGIVVLHHLIQALSKIERNWSYRFVFAPGTIGAITWLSRNRDLVPRIHGGLAVAGVGDRGPLSYKRTRSGSSEIDLLVKRALRHCAREFSVVDFSPDGYDERQYNSPGFDVPVGRLSRTPYATYPEYHTSGDNLDFIRPDSLGTALDVLLGVCSFFERSPRYENLCPHGEPQLGRRGVFHALSLRHDSPQSREALPWLLNYSDGRHCLADIAERSGLELPLLEQVAETLEELALFRPIGGVEDDARVAPMLEDAAPGPRLRSVRPQELVHRR